MGKLRPTKLPGGANDPLPDGSEGVRHFHEHNGLQWVKVIRPGQFCFNCHHELVAIDRTYRNLYAAVVRLRDLRAEVCEIADELDELEMRAYRLLVGAIRAKEIL